MGGFWKWQALRQQRHNVKLQAAGLNFLQRKGLLVLTVVEISRNIEAHVW